MIERRNRCAFLGGTDAIRVVQTYSKTKKVVIVCNLFSFICFVIIAMIIFFSDQQHMLRAVIIALSCVVVLQLIVNAFFLWRQRRAMPDKTDRLNKSTTAADRDDSARDHHVSEPGVYMELHPKPLESRAPLEYQTLQCKNTVPGYYNVGFKRGDKVKNEEVYDEIRSAQA